MLHTYMQCHGRSSPSSPPTLTSHNYFTKVCSGPEKGSYSRFKDFVYHSTLVLRAMKKKKRGFW